MLNIENISKISKASTGYEIEFNDHRLIKLKKRRTLIALLILIHYGVGSEEDLAGGNDHLQTVKTIIQGKYNPLWIKDRYGDANKPFSELWTEEGFTFIEARGLSGNRKYVLEPSDHDKLFIDRISYSRKQLSKGEKELLLKESNYRCNICGSKFQEPQEINHKVFSKDRVIKEFDHRQPIEKKGSNKLENFQVLCHYCNKSKRQICYICPLDSCSESCALVHPESQFIIVPTEENISDRIFHHNNTD